MVEFSTETYTLILRSLGSCSAARARLVSKRFNRAALRAIPYDIDSLHTAHRWIAFCQFMSSNPQYILYSRHITVDDKAFTPPPDHDTIRYACCAIQQLVCNAKNLVTIRLLGDMGSVMTEEVYAAWSGILLPNVRRLDLADMRGALWHPFVNITHLSLNIFISPLDPAYRYLDAHIPNFCSPSPLAQALDTSVIFPALISFAGPLSALIAISKHHRLEHVVLVDVCREGTRPLWISTWADAEDLLWSLQRISAKSITIGLGMPEDRDRWYTFWSRLSLTAPGLESLALTITSLHLGERNNELTRHYVCSNQVRRPD